MELTCLGLVQNLFVNGGVKLTQDVQHYEHTFNSESTHVGRKHIAFSLCLFQSLLV